MSTTFQFPERDDGDSPILRVFSPSSPLFRSIPSPVRFVPPRRPISVPNAQIGMYSSITPSVVVASVEFSPELVQKVRSKPFNNVHIVLTSPQSLPILLHRWWDAEAVECAISQLEFLQLFFNQDCHTKVDFPFRLSSTNDRLTVEAIHNVSDLRSSVLFKSLTEVAHRNHLESVFSLKDVPSDLSKLIISLSKILNTLFSCTTVVVADFVKIITEVLGAEAATLMGTQLGIHIRAIANVLQEVTDAVIVENFLISATYNVMFFVAHYALDQVFPRSDFVCSPTPSPVSLSFSLEPSENQWEQLMVKTSVANVALRSIAHNFENQSNFLEISSLHQQQFSRLSRLGTVAPHFKNQLSNLDTNLGTILSPFELFKHSIVRNRAFSFAQSFISTLIPMEIVKALIGKVSTNPDSHYYSTVVDSLTFSDFLIYYSSSDDLSVLTKIDQDCSGGVIKCLDQYLPISDLFCPALNSTVAVFKDSMQPKSTVPLTTSTFQSALTATKLRAFPRISGALPSIPPIAKRSPPPPRRSLSSISTTDPDLDHEICSHQPHVPNFELRRSSTFGPSQTSSFRSVNKQELRERLHTRLTSFIEDPESLLGKNWVPEISRENNLSTSLPCIPSTSEPKHTRFISMPAQNSLDQSNFNELNVSNFANSLPKLHKSVLSKHELFSLASKLTPNLLNFEVKDENLKFFDQYLESDLANLLFALALIGFKLPCPKANILVKNLEQSRPEIFIEIFKFIKNDYKFFNHVPSSSRDWVVFGAVNGILTLLPNSTVLSQKLAPNFAEIFTFLSKNTLKMVNKVGSIFAVNNDVSFSCISMTQDSVLQSFSQSNLIGSSALLLSGFNSALEVMDTSILFKTETLFFRHYCTTLQSLSILYSKLVNTDTDSRDISDLLTLIIGLTKTFSSLIIQTKRNLISDVDFIIVKHLINSLLDTRYDALLPHVVHLMTSFGRLFKTELMDQSIFKNLINSMIFCHENIGAYCTNLVSLISNLHCTFSFTKSPIKMCLESGLSHALVIVLLRTKKSLLHQVFSSLLAFSGLRSSRSFRSTVNTVFQEMFVTLRRLNIGPLFDLIASSSVFLSHEKLIEFSSNFSNLVERNGKVVDEIIVFATENLQKL
ncbi:hypothetical protein RCL1_004806 [Eukaryota sp. TZLM3-RCL]